MASTHYRHIFLDGVSQTHGFTSPSSGGSQTPVPERNREEHSSRLLSKIQNAWDQSEERQAVLHVERHGAYVDFESDPGSDLVTKSLEDMSAGIRLLNVRTEGVGEARKMRATVYIPHDKRSSFLRKLQAYAREDTSSGIPKNQKLINSIGDIHRSVLESFWRLDERSRIPDEDPAWVEIWLRDSSVLEDDASCSDEFRGVASEHNIEVAEGELVFPERTVLLLKANRSQLEYLIEASDDVAEFRFAKEVASFFVELENRDQVEWVQELLDRTSYDPDSDVAVCILDHGINNGHLLIQSVLNDEDCHTVLPQWGVQDDEGHGTLMAGTVAYGDILEVLNSTDNLRVSHRLESAKIVPPPPAVNPQQLWGLRTAQGISRAEIQAPDRKRIICMAVTSRDSIDRGRPSSWSAEVDKIISGADGDRQRFFIVSAGNEEDPDVWRNYPDGNITSEVHDPGQAWNVLTVGSYTEKVHIKDATLAGYSAIAPSGGLSPYSTTSVNWQKWPIKPEVVFEGGNVAKGPNDSIFGTEDLKLLSTCKDPQVAQFAPFEATSASSALAACTAAKIQVQYPEAWPETIRALMVHSASWTAGMRSQFLPAHPNKGDCERLLRICGYGVPDLEKALFCAKSSLTMIAQARLQPYDYENSVQQQGRSKTKDMHFYNLPWPVDVLRGLGEIQVKMRITLSYFIEPGPGEVGWQDRYRYPSHLLRFELNGALESEDEFMRRVNNQAREDAVHPGTQGASDKWTFGQARNVGSIHSDIWIGTASELAESNKIAVYPAIGWWRERKHLKRVASDCRYSLVVSIETPSEEIDVYTPVAIQVGIPIEVSI